jgi:NAD(P)-dependent dehydrogenase (short-subunit alcohol dehydrogenase family)
MKNKIVLITGATSGIGKATAIALAKQGAHLVLHGRNAAKITALKQELIELSGNNYIDILVADLFLMADVRKMAVEFNNKYNHLDVLINNAGMMMGNMREETAEGIEKTIALNLFAPFLLTTLLLPKLKASESARIINISSSAQQQNAKPDFNDFQSRHNYSPLKVYGNTKLFLILMGQYMARSLKVAGISNITVNSLHPGAVASNFSVESNLGWLLNTLGKLVRRFFKTPEQGADTIIYLATSPEVEGVSGKYFIDRKYAVVNKKYDTVENEEIIWKYCEKETKIIL